MKTLKTYLAYALTLTFVLSLTACQAPKDKTPGWSSKSGEVRPGPKTGKAVLALLKKARHASKQGSLSSAESHLERAIFLPLNTRAGVAQAPMEPGARCTRWAP